MKWTLPAVLLGVLACGAAGQEYTGKPVYKIDSPINIAKDEVNKRFIPPPPGFRQLKSASASETPASIEVTYVNFPEEAKQAFEYAISIWESLISSPVTINVLAKWEYISENILAKSRPSVFYNNFSGCPLKDIYYPVTLAEKLSGREVNPGSPDIICNFNNKYPWYFGTDGNTPETKYDFVSSVLHEITHGLGFSGFYADDNGFGYYDNSNNLPSIYDYFIYNYLNQQLSDKSLFGSPSKELHNQLTSEKLKIISPENDIQSDNTIEWVYAPAKWNKGSSIYHLTGYSYGDENSLMTPAACKGEAIHDPGEKTMAILSKIGWQSVSFNFEQLKDIEETCNELPVDIGIDFDADESLSNVKIIFSADYFKTHTSVDLYLDENINRYTGKIPVNNFTGTLQYYFVATTENKESFKYPANAPQRKFNLRIGPDYFVPDLSHNPVLLVYKPEPTIELSALANDNIGIKSVKAEYKINGVLQESVSLSAGENDLYCGTIRLPGQILQNGKFEYRITAVDNSAQNNTRSLPSMGFYKVDICETKEPVSSYSTDFEEGPDDFICTNFSISSIPGFTGNILHTYHPYPVSALDNEKFNLIALLKHPVILKENGEMSFKEIVLVETGVPGSMPPDPGFMDYVIVEGSKDDGKTWLPLSEGYDSSTEYLWTTEFSKNITNSTSITNGHESMFINHTINLTENRSFQAGDTVMIRFRLASDNSVNGWGWAIDDLKVQQVSTASEDILAENSMSVYPNPFRDSFYVNCENIGSSSPVEIAITDLSGKTILHKTGIDAYYSPNIKIDFSDKSPGIYLINVTDGDGFNRTNKLIKK